MVALIRDLVALAETYGPWAIFAAAWFFTVWRCEKKSDERESQLRKALNDNTQAMTILAERLR